MLRMFFFSIVLVIATGIGAFLTILFGIFNAYSTLNTWVLQSWGKVLVWASGMKLEVLGMENIDPNGSYIVICNHQSNMDIPVTLGAIPLPIRIIAKKELFKIPIFGWGMQSAGILSVDRSNRKKAIQTLKKASEIIKNNQLSILAFPEGTRSPDGKIHPFKKGPFVVAITSQLPLLPVTINGTRNILPKKKLKIRRGKVSIRIHPPLSTKNLTLDQRNNLVTEARQIIESKFEENFK